MNQARGSAFVLGPGEGRSIDLGNFAMSVKATGAETGAGFALLEAAEPPGFGPPMHIHHDAAEAFYVLAGSTSSSSRTGNSPARLALSSTSRSGCDTASASAASRAES
jgi:hypothetical protein